MIKVARLDDRLIHGQVSTSWTRAFSIQLIIVVDDKVVTDKVQLPVLKMAAPAGTRLYVLDEKNFLQKYHDGTFDPYNTMLIFNNVETINRLVEGGLKLTSLNLGGVRFREGRRKYTKAVSLSEDEKDLLLKIASHGVALDLRQLVTDQSVNFEKVLREGEK